MVARRRLAIVACLLWLLGVEVLPAVHQGTHASAAPHRHEAGGMVVTVSFDAPSHRHADGSVHAHHGAAPVKHRRDTKSRVTGDGAHADGLAHHATALIAAAPPLTKPLPVDRRPSFVVREQIQILVSSTVPEAAARGPPVRAS
jgi:hypothetical protein